MRCQLPLVRMADMWKSEGKWALGRMWRKRACIFCIVDGIVNNQCGKPCRDSNNPLVGPVFKGNKKTISRSCLGPTYLLEHCSRQPFYGDSLDCYWRVSDREDAFIQMHTEIRFLQKKEGNPALCDRRTLVLSEISETQMLCDSTYG